MHQQKDKTNILTTISIKYLAYRRQVKLLTELGKKNSIVTLNELDIYIYHFPNNVIKFYFFRL